MEALLSPPTLQGMGEERHDSGQDFEARKVVKREREREEERRQE
jgi:hypothetical protein